MSKHTYRFAGFELTVDSGELRTGQSVVRLQEKPLLLLRALLDRPQDLVTRAELRERMWDRRTVVDFEQGINVAVKKIRDALGDSAETPRFIETVARKGYRFLLPVEVGTTGVATAQGAVAEAAPAATTTLPVTDIPKSVAAPVPDGTAAPRAEGESAAGGPSIRYRLGRHPLRIAAAALLLITLGVLAVQMRPRHVTKYGSLAVLPLEDLSPDGGRGFFADGITEEIITSLAQKLPLRVISRTSVMQYRHTQKSITQIARELGVDAVVEGAVSRSGDRMSLTVQLIDAAQDRHLWAGRYERRLEDVLALEGELSEAIAGEVAGTLRLPGTAPSKYRTVDPEVHELYLLGRYHLNRRAADGLDRAEQYFRAAITRDPSYAPGYTGLADVYALRPHYTTISWVDSFAKAKAAARHALELDDTLAEPHATLGLIALNQRATYTQAGEEFQLALQRNPNDPDTHHWRAYQLFFGGRRDEALADIRLARELDPLSAITNADEGHFLYSVRRYDEAIARLQRAMELAPDPASLTARWR